MTPVANYFRFNPSGAFSIDWYIGKRCNFSCSYCVDYLHDNHSPHVPLENMKYLVDLVVANHGNNTFWSLTGGEPTVNPNLIDLCKYIKIECGTRNLNVTTNGSRTSKYFKELFQYVDNITLSLHFEHISNRIDEYIEKCIDIENWRREWNYEQNLNEDFPNWDIGYGFKTFLIRFMIYPSKINTVLKMEKAFRDHGITNIEYRYIRAPFGNERIPNEKINFEKNHELLVDKDLSIKRTVNREKLIYNEKENKIINDHYSKNIPEERKKITQWFLDENGNYTSKNFHYNDLNFNQKNNFNNWICWAGIKQLKITPTGDIYAGNCHVGGKRGNIYNIDSIDLPKEPIRCPKWSCKDAVDLKVPKIKDWNHYHLIKNIIENS